MRIGLIDVDGKSNGKPFPNYALMKISTYHKTIGDSVEWYDQLKMEEENAIPYDIVYMSKIFNFSLDYQFNIKANNIIQGGTGYNIISKLPYEIENCKPEYSPFGYQWTWEDRHKRKTGGCGNKHRPVPIECHRCRCLVSGEDYLDEKSGCVLFDYECISKYHKPIERPPQSWQYIQEKEECKEE